MAKTDKIEPVEPVKHDQLKIVGANATGKRLKTVQGMDGADGVREIFTRLKEINFPPHKGYPLIMLVAPDGTVIDRHECSGVEPEPEQPLVTETP